MPAKTKDRPHPIFVPLTEKEHDALAKAALKENRSTRAHAAHLLGVALGLTGKARAKKDIEDPPAPVVAESP